MKIKMALLNFAENTFLRLLHYVRQQRLKDFSGFLVIGGAVVSDLVPLGGYHQPGLTKAGRLSFSGYCDGRKVKVYSAHSSAQIVNNLP